MSTNNNDRENNPNNNTNNSPNRDFIKGIWTPIVYDAGDSKCLFLRVHRDDSALIKPKTTTHLHWHLAAQKGISHPDW